MPPTKRDYCIASFGHTRCPSVPPRWRLLTFSSGRLPPHAPNDSRGIVVMRDWGGIHERVFVQSLAPLMWLGHVHALGPQYREVTRSFAVLSTGVSDLEEFYSHLDFKLVFEV